MDSKVMVSVICNVYNHGKYVRDALEGFVTQKTDFPFEVLVHDDASTDNSADVIREYEAKYPDIIKPIYQTENQYSRGGKITGRFQLPRVQGKYIAMCEGDDYWTDPQKLQKQFDFMEANPEYALCTCSTVWLDMRTGQISSRCMTTEDRDISLEEIIVERKGRMFQYATFFLRKEDYVRLPEWAGHFGVGDTPLAMYAATIGKVRMLADVMAVYRNHTEGSWTSRMDSSAELKVRSYDRMIGGLREFNEATGYKYDKAVAERIKRLRYNIARVSRDWKAICSDELRTIYKSRSFTARMSDMLYCKAPRLEAAIRKVLGK